MSALNSHGGWPGRTATSGEPGKAGRELQRLVSADHPDQRLIPVRTVTPPLSLRVDPTHELPIEIYEGRGHVVARFAHAYEAAAYLHARWRGPTMPRLTLPLPIATALAAMAGEADPVSRLREGGGL